MLSCESQHLKCIIIHLSISISLSLYIYTYIYTHTHTIHCFIPGSWIDPYQFILARTGSDSLRPWAGHLFQTGRTVGPRIFRSSFSPRFLKSWWICKSPRAGRTWMIWARQLYLLGIYFITLFITLLVGCSWTFVSNHTCETDANVGDDAHVWDRCTQYWSPEHFDIFAALVFSWTRPKDRKYTAKTSLSLWPRHLISWQLPGNQNVLNLQHYNWVMQLWNTIAFEEASWNLLLFGYSHHWLVKVPLGELQ